MDVSTEALTLAVLGPPALFGAAVAVESWRSHRAAKRAAMRRHPSALREAFVCPECGGNVFDLRVHRTGGYCEAARDA